MSPIYSYVLLRRCSYDGPYLLGVVNNLNDAHNYYNKNINNKDQDDDFIVQVWKNTRRICTFIFNTETKLLEKQEKKPWELGDDNLNF
jgi:hypothetical protein